MSSKYSAEHLEFLRVGYDSMGIPDLARAFNTKFGTGLGDGAIKGVLARAKILSGRTGRFEKGHVSWSAGTKGLVKPNAGNFKKGAIPPNRRPLGAERICPLSGFVLVKVAEKDPHTGALTRYKHKHVHIWEQANGTRPEGMVVAFKDGNKLNCEIDNLMLISRAELLRLNQYNYKEVSEELKPSVLAVAKLEVKMFKLQEHRKAA